MKLEKSWNTYLSAELEKDYMISLKDFLKLERQDYLVYPKEKELFNAFHKTPFNKLKIVLLGQDPYHGEGQAHGLSFSVPKEVNTPPSLMNIFKEIENDLNIKNQGKGDLTKWAEQGVLLLNSILTVRKDMAGSHQNKGWEQFTDKVISTISSKKEGVIFLLWGNFAQNKQKLIDKSKHHILMSSHPSPLSSYRGFIGCKHFSECNKILKKENKTEINWKL